MDTKKLNEIKERAKKSPGGWYTDGCGSPVVCSSFGTRIIDNLHKSDLYLRRKKSETGMQELSRLFETAKWLDDLLSDAYQAMKDRRELIEEIERLQNEKK